MQQRRLGRITFTLAAILVMAVSLTVLGCGDGGIDPQDLQNRTFQFDNAQILDQNFPNTTVTIAFGTVTNNALPFTITLGNGAVITGTATIGSPLNCPSDAAVDVNLDGDTSDDADAQLNEDVCDVDVSRDEANNQETFTWRNDDTNATAEVVFTSGETGTGTGSVTTGSSTTSQ